LEETEDADALVGRKIDMRGYTNPLKDFSETTVGFFGRSLWALRDTLMGLFVVKIFKSRVTLKDPSILPFLPSVMTVSPVTD
jgi:hypothetical protein